MVLTQKQWLVAYLRYYKSISDLARGDGCFEVCRLEQVRARSLTVFSASTSIVTMKQSEKLLDWVNQWVI